MVDYMTYPWFERHVYLKNILEYELDKDKFPNLTAWIKRMKQLPAVKETATNPEQLIEFHKSYSAGRPDYDVGLE
jgi:glutathione S-transferase